MDKFLFSFDELMVYTVRLKR